MNTVSEQERLEKKDPEKWQEREESWRDKEFPLCCKGDSFTSDNYKAPEMEAACSDTLNKCIIMNCAFLLDFVL